uniref:Uncharacterized protein n=1 Tax=Ascaris lumbricoides TaxID=6252 RepID=A0A0M3HYZ8_ASCLU
MEMLEHSAHKLTNLMLELNERYAGRKKPAPLNVVTEDSDMHMFNVDVSSIHGWCNESEMLIPSLALVHTRMFRMKEHLKRYDDRLRISQQLEADVQPPTLALCSNRARKGFNPQPDGSVIITPICLPTEEISRDNSSSIATGSTGSTSASSHCRLACHFLVE